MSALRGATEHITDMLDQPDKAFDFAGRVTALLIEFGRWGNECIGDRQEEIGGTATGWRVWMPRGAMYFSEDASVMYSSDFYRRHIKPLDQRLTSAFTKTILEVHQEGNHQITEFGGLSGVSLMTIEGFSRMRPEHKLALRQLLGRKAFYFAVRPEEVEETLAFAGTRGVMLALSAPDVPTAHTILHDLERTTQRLLARPSRPPNGSC
jgi:hypothetical protein